MLNQTALQKYRSELGIDQIITNMMSTADKVAVRRRDLADLNRRVKDRESDVAGIELPFLDKVSKNGKNADQRKVLFETLCQSSNNWQMARQDLDDAIFHRNMVQAEIDGLTIRFTAQRHASDLIAATLSASCE